MIDPREGIAQLYLGNADTNSFDLIGEQGLSISEENQSVFLGIGYKSVKMTGQFSEFLWYDGRLTDSDMEDMYEYLSEKRKFRVWQR